MRIPSILSRLTDKSLSNPLGYWNKAHLSRRAGVLLILSPLSRDEFDVLLTIRSQHLSYAGDAAFPGGRADNETETPWETAVREAQEEIGIEPSSVEHVATLPGYVSSNMLLVVPSVAWSPTAPDTSKFGTNEVYKVFKVPLSRFLKAEGHHFDEGKLESGAKIRLSHFDIRAAKRKIGDPLYDRVWGLTANILIDCARLVYNKEPEFQFHRGNDPLIRDATKIGNTAILDTLVARNILQKPVKRKPRPS